MKELNEKELNEVNGGYCDQICQITNENVVGGPLNPAIDNKDIPTDEETWLG